VNWLGKFYQWLWYTFEFWLTPVNRRPLTFIMRDWIFTHGALTASLVVIWIAILFAVCFTQPFVALVLAILSFFLLAHLVWGSKWIEGQQENPQYVGLLVGTYWDGTEWKEA